MSQGSPAAKPMHGTWMHTQAHRALTRPGNLLPAKGSVVPLQTLVLGLLGVPRPLQHWDGLQEDAAELGAVDPLPDAAGAPLGQAARQGVSAAAGSSRPSPASHRLPGQGCSPRPSDSLHRLYRALIRPILSVLVPEE